MRRAPLARILIVDDESELRSALCRILEAQGYAMSGAASGLEAMNHRITPATGFPSGEQV
jgi:DNA-binding response OmpR family regulator